MAYGYPSTFESRAAQPLNTKTTEEAKCPNVMTEIAHLVNDPPRSIFHIIDRGPSCRTQQIKSLNTHPLYPDPVPQSPPRKRRVPRRQRHAGQSRVRPRRPRFSGPMHPRPGRLRFSGPMRPRPRRPWLARSRIRRDDAGFNGRNGGHANSARGNGFLGQAGEAGGGGRGRESGFGGGADGAEAGDGEREALGEKGLVEEGPEFHCEFRFRAAAEGGVHIQVHFDRQKRRELDASFGGAGRLAAQSGFVVSGGEGGRDLRELEHHGDIEGPDAGKLDSKGEFGLGEGGGGDRGSQSSHIKVWSDVTVLEASRGAAAGVLDVHGDLRRVGDRGAEPVGERSGALERGTDPDLIADRRTEMEYSGNGNSRTGNACCEKLLGIRKGVYFLDGRHGGRELEVCHEILGLALEGERL